MKLPTQLLLLLLLVCNCFAGPDPQRTGYTVSAGTGAEEYHVDLLTDAFIIQKHLKATHPEAAISNSTEPGANKVDFTRIVPPVFNLPAESVAGLAVRNLSNRAEYTALEQIDHNGTDEEYGLALSQFESVSDTDPLKGYILANQSILLLKQKRYDEALALAKRVANGEVESAAAHRVMAMVRVAWLTHNHKKDRLTAYQAYREIENFSGSEAVKIRCRVEQAGLLMELAESAKGSHADVRAYVESVRAMMPEGYLKQRAVLDLIYMESFSRQPDADYETAIELAEQFLTSFSVQEDPELVREIASVTGMTGMWYSKKGDREKALEYYSMALDFPAEAEYFLGCHPHAEALLGISYIAEQLEEPEIAEELRCELIRSHPESFAARGTARALPGLLSRPASPEFDTSSRIVSLRRKIAGAEP